MKTYDSPQEVETLVVIGSWTAWRWLCKLGYEYKNICKDIFVDGHEQSDVSEDCKNFLKKTKKLKPYKVNFDKDSIVKPKIYTFDCEVDGNDWQPIVVIPHEECRFPANDRVWKA